MNNGSGDKLYEQIARGAEATQLVVTEVEDLRNQNSRMSSDLMLMRERNNQLEGRLKVASAERDHYMRYCMEINTRLNNIQLMINSAVDESKYATYRPQQLPVPQADSIPTADVKQLENLIQRLPKQNGDTNG
jgi:FtsZ-binding cell division protein ZapB